MIFKDPWTISSSCEEREGDEENTKDLTYQHVTFKPVDFAEKDKRTWFQFSQGWL